MSIGYEIIFQENVLQDTLHSFSKELSFFVQKGWLALEGYSPCLICL